MPVVRYRLFDRWTILILFGVGTFMFWGAGHYSVFDDEGFSCRRYTMPLGEMVTALWHGEEPDPPLYYILQNIWVHIFGVGPLGMRSLSIMMFLIGLVFIRLAGSEWYDPLTGRLAMLIAAVHPAHLLFGLAGRWYSMMFCLVALLVWFTSQLSRRAGRWDVIGWSLTAASVCYTNYFGVVVVGLLWVTMFLRFKARREWWNAGFLTILLYACWLPAFWKQATSFPRFNASMSQYGDTGVRIMMALFTGNLASIAAWWIWLPLFACAVCGSRLVRTKLRNWRSYDALSYVVAVCILTGVVSLTIIDKYVMAFSGLLCIHLAAAALRNCKKGGPPRIVMWSRVVASFLGLAWLGCYVNLVTERHWSSLRWLDPYEQVINDLANWNNGPLPGDWVMSQPAARYYYACMMVRRAMPTGIIRTDDWRRFAVPPSDRGSSVEAAATPESMLDRMKDELPQRLATVRGSEFAEALEWSDLQKVLEEAYELAGERTYLKDPDAKWKDRFDPAFKHPEWRITVRIYERKDQQ